MKQNLLTHLMRLTILFLLFFGAGTGSAVGATGLECGGTTPTKPTALASDLADPAVGPALLDFLSGNTAGITAAARVNRLKAWEKVFHVDIPQQIRTNTTYLSAISKQIENYGDDIAFQFERVLPHVDPADYNKFFTALDNPKSIDHVRSLAGDFENIPGINLSNYTPNGLPEIDIPAPNTWADPLLALPAESATTFTNATAKTLSPGTKIYRVIGDNYPAGGSWAYELPTGRADFFGNYAVRPEWNGAAQYVEFTVPSTGLKVWDGPIAKQSVLDGVNEAHFIGGKTQIYVPEPYRQVDNAFDNLTPIDLPW